LASTCGCVAVLRRILKLFPLVVMTVAWWASRSRSAVERHKAQLVEDEQVDTVHPALEARELASVAGLEQRAYQVGGAPEGDVPALPGGLEPEGDGEVRLPGADGPAKIRLCASSIQLPRASRSIQALRRRPATSARTSKKSTSARSPGR
jgi:hypothetical protein